MDKKSKYSPAPTNYTDHDGQTKTFTVIDHDRHVTRTQMGRERKEKVTVLDELHKTVEEILTAGTNTHPSFIEAFDGPLAAKYGYERFRKGTVITQGQLLRPDENWEWEIKILHNDIQNKLNRKDS